VRMDEGAGPARRARGPMREEAAAWRASIGPAEETAGASTGRLHASGGHQPGQLQAERVIDKPKRWRRTSPTTVGCRLGRGGGGPGASA
jgi:hypothetical protein